MRNFERSSQGSSLSLKRLANGFALIWFISRLGQRVQPLRHCTDIFALEQWPNTFHRHVTFTTPGLKSLTTHHDPEPLLPQVIACLPC